MLLNKPALCQVSNGARLAISSLSRWKQYSETIVPCDGHGKYGIAVGGWSELRKIIESVVYKYTSFLIKMLFDS